MYLVLALLLSTPAEALDLTRRADEALRGGDAVTAVVLFERAAAAVPGDPRFLFHVARAQAAAGRRAEAVATLARTAELGGGLRALEDEAFAGLRSDPANAKLFERLRKANEPSGAGTVAYRIAERDLVPEGIARDPSTGELYLGSLKKHKVVRVDRDGRVTDFVPSGAHGLLSALGLRVDPERRHLWVLTAGDDRAGDRRDATGALVFDLGGGQLVRKVTLDVPGEKHLWNDLVIADDGTAWITDSEAGAVLKLAPRASAAEVVHDGLVYPNGIARVGRRVFVAHAFGVAVFDLAQGGPPYPLEPVDGQPIYGFDGLYAEGADLIGVQNGVEPARLVRLRLDPEARRVVAVEVLASARPEFDVPTTAALADGRAFVIANSQLPRYMADKDAAAEAFDEVVILEVPTRSEAAR